MDVRVLRYFVAITQEGSLTRGAQAVGVSQPSVTRQIRALETDLGVRLFERGHGPLHLTQAGRRFLIMAKDLVRREDAARRVLRAADTPEEYRLLVVAPQATISSGLAPLMASSASGIPIIDAIEAEPAHVFERLTGLGADVGISTVAPPAGWECERVATLTVRAHMSTDHPLARLDQVDLTELVRHQLIVMDRSNSARLAFDRGLSEAGLALAGPVEMRSSTMAQGLAAGRGGIAVLSSLPEFGLTAVPIVSRGQTIEMTSFAGWEVGHYAEPLIRGFLDRLRARLNDDDFAWIGARA